MRRCNYILIYLVILAFGCQSIPLKEKQEAEMAKKECYEFSKEDAAIVLTMAESDMLKAKEALDKGFYRHAKQYYTLAKKKYYEARLEALLVKHLRLKEILTELLNANKIKNKITKEVKEMKDEGCSLTKSVNDEAQLLILDGDKKTFEILTYISNDNYFRAGNSVESIGLRYKNALSLIQNFRKNHCKH